MKKLLLICHIFFGFTYTNVAQNTFEKTYGSSDFEEAKSVCNPSNQSGLFSVKV